MLFVHITEHTAQKNFEERNQIYRWKMIADLEKIGGKDIEIAMQIGRLRDKTNNQEVFNLRQRYYEKKMQ